MSTSHSRAAKKFLKNQNYADWHDNTFWGVRKKRDAMAFQLPEWEELRQKASDIKRHTLTNIDHYLEQFADAAATNGTIVHWAGDAQEFNEVVLNILRSHGAKKLVKSKSMLTEETEMNPYLEANGIEVVETDLGERILQLDDEKPSHIVMPATHLSHDDVGRIFEKHLHTDPGDHDPTYLTYMARLDLRKEFLTADAGLTGANFGVAETGDIVVCTNEGNADMSTSIPKLQIAAIGLEKLVPDYESLAVFIRLLARSATGQPSTTFTSHFRKARPGASAMHIVIVDNGRSQWLGDPLHWESLKCIRCGECMDTCPVYRWSGGYSYNYFIPGPIGINLGMLRDPHKHAGNVSACTLCQSCQCACPVKVDLADQIYRWRQALPGLGVANKEKKLMVKGMDKIFYSEKLYNTLTANAHWINNIPEWIKGCCLNPWAYGHKTMTFPPKPFHKLFEEEETKENS
ncbi:MAG: LUD domain-containing protein [Clostridium sp.]|nr:LUD domain-containing protein [Prevotella sp.]MCM1429673.1 LUD domain-containing protein [Clostridium sp.]MCM1476172.1 LUD domain-containing protein [Muribaculaceae bacterium]